MDLQCAVCREPWDSYGVNHGDMAKWQAELFRKGAGCPCCEGAPPLGDDPLENHEAAALSVVMNSEDPHAFQFVNELGLDVQSVRPRWRRPEDSVWWQCDGCKNRLLKSAEDGEVYWKGPTVPPYVSQFTHWDWWQAANDDEPGESLFALDGQSYCPACATKCDDCSEAIFREGDVYEGAGLPPPDDEYGPLVCHDCYYERESQIESRLRAEWERHLENLREDVQDAAREWRRVKILRARSGEGLPGVRGRERWAGQRWDHEGRRWVHTYGPPVRLSRRRKRKLQAVGANGTHSKRKWASHWANYRPGVSEQAMDDVWNALQEAIEDYQKHRANPPKDD